MTISAKCTNAWRAIWAAPITAALEQVADAIATIPADEFRIYLMYAPRDLQDQLRDILNKRHPGILGKAAVARQQRQRAIAKEAAKRQRIREQNRRKKPEHPYRIRQEENQGGGDTNGQIPF
jgi:hypothetical protein